MFSSLGSNHLTAHLTAMKRLAPDPSISISDLMGPFETMFKEMGCWDLLSLVEPPKNGKVTWKSAADPSWLGQRHVSQLFQRLFKGSSKDYCFLCFAMMVEAGRFCVNLRPKASSPKASSAKASSAEGHLSWNVRIIFVLVGLLFPLLC